MIKCQIILLKNISRLLSVESLLWHFPYSASQNLKECDTFLYRIFLSLIIFTNNDP